MATKSSIEWTEATWNPIIGCSIVSPGCTNCYAMNMAARTEAMGISRYDGTTKRVNGKAVWTGKLVRAPEATLLAPLKRKKPTTYFVNSMGDLFHEDCPDEWIDQVFAVMALCPQHTFQVLTKRATRMREYMTPPERKRTIAAHTMPISCKLAAGGGHKARIKLDHFSTCFAGSGPFQNVWLGVSTERQQEADERIPLLLQTPAAVWFISAEPLLGPIDLAKIIVPSTLPDAFPNGELALAHLDWVIAGGESGRDARPMHPDWSRSLRDQCAVAGVPFFFKQWGRWKPLDQIEERVIHGAGRHALIHRDGRCVIDTDIADPPEAVFTFEMNKKLAGRHLDGQLHDAMPLTAPCQRTDDRLPHPKLIVIHKP